MTFGPRDRLRVVVSDQIPGIPGYQYSRDGKPIMVWWNEEGVWLMQPHGTAHLTPMPEGYGDVLEVATDLALDDECRASAAVMWFGFLRDFIGSLGSAEGSKSCH